MLYLKPNAARARNAVLVQVISIIISIANIFCLSWQYSLLLQLRKDPASYDVATLTLNDQIQRGIAIVSVVMILINFIFFVLWFRRAYYNVHQLPAAQVSYSDGWAVGGYFIPFVNLVRPYQIMKEVWEQTQNAVAHRLGQIAPAGFVGIWWASHLVDNIYGYVTARAGSADDIPSLITSTQMGLIGECISIVACVIAIVLIRRVTHFERELQEEARTPSESVFSLISGDQPAE